MATPDAGAAPAAAATPTATADTAEKHQVIIVGGGITGLTMALMLERLGIDYILLEAYGSVTPQHGASIGLYANSMRILDQLGIYSELGKVGIPTGTSVHRDGTKGGKVIMRRKAGAVMTARHGYNSYIMSRYAFLTVLYGGIKDKGPLHVNKRVTKIDDSLGNCARVYTTDGCVYEGQMIVGADGIRSFVRDEMWRHAEEELQQKQESGSTTTSTTTPTTTTAKAKASKKSSKTKTKNKSSTNTTSPLADKAAIIPCEHACIFGTARPKPGIAPSDLIVSCNMRSTAGLMGGPDGDIHFFWFWTLPPSQNSCPITAIPRLSEADKQQQLEACKDVRVTDDGLTMGDIVGDLKYSGVTVLPHFVMKRWFHGRMVLLGDAAHKFNPLVGQGGNSAVESCASLVNALQEYVLGDTAASEKVGAMTEFPLANLHKAFTALEKERISRVEEMVERSQDAMRKVAWESWKPKLLTRYIMPILPLGKLVDFYSWFITPGVRLYGDRFGAPPAVEHTVLYEDEKRGGGGVGKGLGSGLPAAAAVAA